MAMNYELERHIEAARRAGKPDAVKTLEAYQRLFNSLVNAKVIEELPREEHFILRRAEQVILIPKQLVEKKSEAWKEFLEGEITIPNLPQEFYFLVGK